MLDNIAGRLRQKLTPDLAMRSRMREEVIWVCCRCFPHVGRFCFSSAVLRHEHHKHIKHLEVKKAAAAHREQLEEFLQKVPLLQTMEVGCPMHWSLKKESLDLLF